MKRPSGSTTWPLLDGKHQVKAFLALGFLGPPPVDVRLDQDSDYWVTDPSAHRLARFESNGPAPTAFAVSATRPCRRLEAGEFLTAMWAMAVSDDARFFCVGHHNVIVVDTANGDEACCRAPA